MTALRSCCERADLRGQRATFVRREGRGTSGAGGHGEVHGRRSNMRERSRAGAECVSAPTEMKSTPVSAAARTVVRSMLPEASSSARPATSVADRAHRRPGACCRAGSGSRRRPAPRAPRSARLGLDLDRQPGRGAARRCTAAVTPPAAVDVVLLDQHHVEQAEAMRRPAARDDRGLLERRAASAWSCACRGSARPCPRSARRSARSASRRRDRRCRKFSAVRSAVRIAAAAPVDAQDRRPGLLPDALGREALDLDLAGRSARTPPRRRRGRRRRPAPSA